MNSSDAAALTNGAQLRSLHKPGATLLLPNVWDVATARAVVKAGYPVVATTSSASPRRSATKTTRRLPPRRCSRPRRASSRCVDVPVTVDAEAGYGMEPAELVAALRDAGAAGCNLEDTEYSPGIPHDHAAGTLRDPLGTRSGSAPSAKPPRSPRLSARDQRPGRQLPQPLHKRVPAGTQLKLVPEALERASAYLEAGADCVYPIGLWEPDALGRFMSEVRGPVNVTRVPQVASVADLAALGVSRVSWALYLYFASMAHFEDQLRSLKNDR